jgi:hypothetical protein
MNIANAYAHSSRIASRAMVELGKVPTVEVLKRELFWPMLRETYTP